MKPGADHKPDVHRKESQERTEQSKDRGAQGSTMEKTLRFTMEKHPEGIWILDLDLDLDPGSRIPKTGQTPPIRLPVKAQPSDRKKSVPLPDPGSGKSRIVP